MIERIYPDQDEEQVVQFNAVGNHSRRAGCRARCLDVQDAAGLAVANDAVVWLLAYVPVLIDRGRQVQVSSGRVEDGDGCANTVPKAFLQPIYILYSVRLGRVQLIERKAREQTR